MRFGQDIRGDGLGRAEVPTRPRFLRPTGTRHGQMAQALCKQEHRGYYATRDLSRQGLDAFRARYLRGWPRVLGSIGTAEIPQVDRDKTRPTGASTVSAGRSGLLYCMGLVLAQTGCVPGEISVGMALGVQEYRRDRDSSGRQGQDAGGWRGHCASRKI